MDGAKLNKLAGANIRRMRKSAGWTQEALAAEANVELRYLGSVERGQANPSLNILARIAKVLRCHPSVLLSEGKSRS